MPGHTKRPKLSLSLHRTNPGKQVGYVIKHKTKMALLGTIFTIIIVFYLINLVFKIVIRHWINKNIYKSGGSFFHRQNAPRKEGDIRIDKQAKEKRVKSDVGEYVDFEEM